MNRGKLNRSTEAAYEFIKEQTGKMTTKEIGFALGVSGARVSQMRGEMKGPSTTEPANDPSTAPEAA